MRRGDLIPPFPPTRSPITSEQNRQRPAYTEIMMHIKYVRPPSRSGRCFTFLYHALQQLWALCMVARAPRVENAKREEGRGDREGLRCRREEASERRRTGRRRSRGLRMLSRSSVVRRQDGTNKLPDGLSCAFCALFYFLRNGVIDAVLYVLFTAWCFCGGFVVNFGVRAAVG